VGCERIAVVKMPTFLVTSPIERMGTVGAVGCSWTHIPADI
jgi:hypothetical protein